MDIDRFARISGRPAIPPFVRGKRVIRLGLGELLVNLLQVVKWTNTSLLITPLQNDEGIFLLNVRVSAITLSPGLRC